jgi:hypothetical protein
MRLRAGEMRLNGCGTKFLGIRREADRVTGTYWVTLLFIPIIPLYKATIAYPKRNRVLVSEKTKLDFRDVMWTYLWGWLLIPLVVFGPILLGITTIALMRNGMLGTIIYLLGFIWAGIAVWKLADWDDRRRGRR